MSWGNKLPSGGALGSSVYPFHSDQEFTRCQRAKAVQNEIRRRNCLFGARHPLLWLACGLNLLQRHLLCSSAVCHAAQSEGANRIIATITTWAAQPRPLLFCESQRAISDAFKLALATPRLPKTLNSTPTSFFNFNFFPHRLHGTSTNTSIFKYSLTMKDVDALASRLQGTALTQNHEDESDSEDVSGTSSAQTGCDESSDEDDVSDEEEFQRHLKYLKQSPDEDSRKEIALSPIFTPAVRSHARDLDYEAEEDGSDQEPIFPQHALLGCEAETEPDVADTRLYYNVAVPCSMFICGSQGSGKSHTLSCVLESCLIPSDVSKLCRPLTGLVFHIDTFISEAGGAPCEAAYLASNPNATVRVLCAPTNLGVIKVRLHSTSVLSTQYRHILHFFITMEVPDTSNVRPLAENLQEHPARQS